MHYELSASLHGKHIKTVTAESLEEANDALITLKLNGKYKGECDRIDFNEVDEDERVVVKKVYKMFNLRWGSPTIIRKEPEKLHPTTEKPKLPVWNWR